MAQKKISELSVPELKAFAYDLIAAREQATNQLSQISQLIMQKQSQVVPQKKAEKPKNVPKKSK